MVTVGVTRRLHHTLSLSSLSFWRGRAAAVAVVVVDMLWWHLPYTSCRRCLRRPGVDALLSLLSPSSSFMWACLCCWRWSSLSLSRLGICHVRRRLRRTGVEALSSLSSLSSPRHGCLDIVVLACMHSSSRLGICHEREMERFGVRRTRCPRHVTV